MMLVVAVAMAASAKASPAPTISVYPTEFEVEVGESYVINITVTDVENLFMCVFGLKWNNTVLQLGSIAEGPFLKQGGNTAFMYDPSTIEDINDVGRLDEVSCVILGAAGVSGNGTIATLDFNATALGTSTIEFWVDPASGDEKTILINSSDVEFDHTRIDGSIDVIPEFPAFMFTAVFLLTALLIVFLKKTMWSTNHRTVDVK